MNLLTPLSEITRVLPPMQIALKKLGVLTVGDLLYYFPVRYGDTSSMKHTSELSTGEQAVIFGKITNLKTSKGFKSKIAMSEARITDDTGTIKAVWFHQPYLAKMLVADTLVRLEGKVSEHKGERYMSNPKVETVNTIPIAVGDSLFGNAGESHSLYPVYPETRGISSNWIYHTLQRIFKSGLLDSIQDPVPTEMLEKYSLPTLKTALIWIHTPQKHDHALSARKRFAFEEIFFIQLEKKIERREWQKNPAFVIPQTEADLEPFMKRFPFEATEAQKKAINVILTDFKKGFAMSRLLEGDVGSGKTAVAASTAYAVVTTKPPERKYGNLQVAYMAPTEILAQQAAHQSNERVSQIGNAQCAANLQLLQWVEQNWK